MTVLCPECGGDWELTLPPEGELTVEYCECGAMLELDADGVLRGVRSWRAPVFALPPPAPSSRDPKPVRELLRGLLKGTP